MSEFLEISFDKFAISPEELDSELYFSLDMQKSSNKKIINLHYNLQSDYSCGNHKSLLTCVVITLTSGEYSKTSYVIKNEIIFPLDELIENNKRSAYMSFDISGWIDFSSLNNIYLNVSIGKFVSEIIKIDS